uniref:RNA helicase n=1 Tax=Gasterosteus aculeatus aculeatus TaxID=481459 RepID=A0AAQ4Q3B9_GASAC
MMQLVESPSCIWGRFVQDPGSGTDQYDRLQAQMNLFYKDVTQDLRHLKPTSLEEGQVCVVYWSWMKSWCRAVVESIVMDSVSSQARCLLVDQGEQLISCWMCCRRSVGDGRTQRGLLFTVSYVFCLHLLLPHLRHRGENINPLILDCSGSVVLLCQGWKKAQVVYGLLEDMKVAPCSPLEMIKSHTKCIANPRCTGLLLVTTPFSLVRLLSSHCFLFLRLYHLVLDEADWLFTVAPDQMAAILEHFQKEASSEEKASCPLQLVAAARRWTGHMEGLVEAVLYGNVQQVVLMTLGSSKISVLLGALDFNPVIGQKTVIVADSAEEVEDVWKVKPATHKTLQIRYILTRWTSGNNDGSQTDVCLKSLGVRDSLCVIHYGFPASPKLFGDRLSCMAKNFRNLSERGSSEDQPRLTRSVLLIFERNTTHMVGVVGYLQRTVTPLPPELLSFVRGVQLAREDHKADRPLCSYFKSFGVYRSVCPNRHRFITKLDESLLPSSGLKEVLPLHVKTASVFYGRLVEEGRGGFQSLAAEMSAFYADKKPGAEEVLQGGLYAVQEDEVFHRSVVLGVTDCLFFSVFVRFIDVGNKEEVKSHQVLQLPERFCSLPGQAVEMVVCRVNPSDGEIDWHPEVTRAISQKIQGLQHRARAVFSLGNTVFVDAMVLLTQVPGMKTVINEYSVQAEILNTGMGVTNQEHLNLLRALRRDAEELIPVCGQTPPRDGRAAVGQKSLHTADLKSAEQTTRSAA